MKSIEGFPLLFGFCCHPYEDLLFVCFIGMRFTETKAGDKVGATINLSMEIPHETLAYAQIHRLMSRPDFLHRLHIQTPLDPASYRADFLGTLLALARDPETKCCAQTQMPDPAERAAPKFKPASIVRSPFETKSSGARQPQTQLKPQSPAIRPSIHKSRRCPIFDSPASLESLARLGAATIALLTPPNIAPPQSLSANAGVPIVP